jgi:glutamate-1-semialdehyde 2,1-aminomutase
MTDTPRRTGATSEALYARARSVLAGGISHESRYAEAGPKYITRAAGARKWDVDGNEYVDYAMGSASLLLGHAHPDVIAAISEQLPLGTFYAGCHEREVEWGEAVQRLFPCAEQVRFTGTGTEATMLAVRLARAHSGRPKVLRFEGHYHGWHDYALMGSKPPFDTVPSLGVPPGAQASVVVVAPDIDRVDEVLGADPEIGSVICEVSGANYGCVPLPEGFLAGLREIATRREVVLIFDEVITGFRWSPGGLQARDGIVPDLTSLAKILTGGLPGGAVAGREPIMRLLDPALTSSGLRPGVAHKGTFNASPMVAAAGVAALRHVATGDPQGHADAMASRLRQGMRGILGTHQVPGTVYGDSSTFHVYFGECRDGSVAGIPAARIRGAPKAVVEGLRAGMRSRGVDLMSYMSGVTSWAHGDGDIELTLAAFEDSVRELIGDGLLPLRAGDA